MRNRVRLSALGAAALTAAIAITLTVSTAQAATNTIANPGFEAGNLSSWSCDASASAVTGHAHAGSYALAGAAGADTAQCTQTIPVAANTSYTLTAYVTGSYVFLGVSGGVSASTWTSATAYTPLSVTFSSGTATSVTVFIHGWYGQGTYYADDFVMNGPGGNPSPTASASASRSPSPSASPSRSASPTPSASPSRSTSPSPSTSPTTPPTGSLPRHELTGYWQDFVNTAKPLRLSDVPDQLRPDRGGLRQR